MFKIRSQIERQTMYIACTLGILVVLVLLNIGMLSSLFFSFLAVPKNENIPQVLDTKAVTDAITLLEKMPEEEVVQSTNSGVQR